MEAAQAPSREAAGSSEQRQFDFWLGEWDLSWGDGATAANSIYHDFDGRVIVESFDGRPSLELQGTSLTTYDSVAGVEADLGRQPGNHYGSWAASAPADGLRRPSSAGRRCWMRWFISGDTLDWAWERSDNDGGRAGRSGRWRTAVSYNWSILTPSPLRRGERA